MKYLALGDSYTIGEGVKTSETWPYLLREKLTANGFNFDFPHVIATTGWTSKNLLDALAEQQLTAEYDLVSLLIGVNNQYQKLNFEIYKKELPLLIEKSIKLSKKGCQGVFMVAIPDYSCTPFAQDKNPPLIRKELERYNEFAKNAAQKYNIKFYDIFNSSQQASHNNTLLTSDLLHPSGEMYIEWCQLITKSMKFFKKIIVHV